MRALLAARRRRLCTIGASILLPEQSLLSRELITKTGSKDLGQNAPAFSLQIKCLTTIAQGVDRNLIDQAASEQSIRGLQAGGGKFAPTLSANARTLTGIRDGLGYYGRCYWELSKARLSMLVVATSGAGFVMGSGGSVDMACLGWTCVGTMMAAASANSFNQILEVRNDAAMKRTMRRPLPSGRLSIEHAMVWATTGGVLGVSLLALKTNNVVAALGAANILLYTLAYTPLKQIHPVNTWIGAVVGAIPPLMGWAAATGSIDAGAWVLAAALYFWQLPHFMALAFMCSNDYLNGGYKMLTGNKTASVALRNCVYLLPIGFAAQYVGISSGWLGPEAAALAAGMGVTAGIFYLKPSLSSARNLFRTSLLYLPLLMTAMLIHRIPNHTIHQQVVTEPVTETTEVILKDDEDDELKKVKKNYPAYLRSPIAYASAAPFPFLPVPMPVSFRERS